MNIQQAVERLNCRLPLKARHDRLPTSLKTLHQYILKTLAFTGHVPSAVEMVKALGKRDVSSALQRLSGDDLIVIEPNSHKLVGAYPVTTEKTPHKINLNGYGLYAMCALDAVSVAPLFEQTVQIESSCHVSGAPLRIDMQGFDVKQVEPNAEIMVGIRWQYPKGAAAHSMCLEMVFLQDRPAANHWQKGDTVNISLFTLTQAIAFGAAFFKPLME